MEQILFRAMGSEIFGGVDGDHSRIRERLARVPAMFEAWEQTLSRFRLTSELSRLNARAGETVRVSETMWRVLKLARRAEELSEGLVTPTVLPVLERAGYDRSFEQMPGAAAPPALGPGTDRAQSIRPPWQLHAANHAVTLAPGTRLDLGGVAKGWAVEQAALYLGELGPSLVDGGGDMSLTAPHPDGSPWILGIEDPFTQDSEASDLPLLAVPYGGVATSGRTWRKWTQAGKPMHHLIDPRTGLPAETDVLSATVLAPTVFEAEVAAKVILILGSVQGLQWIAAHPALAALMICQNGRCLYNSRMENYIV